jgi:hypothetical protein
MLKREMTSSQAKVFALKEFRVSAKEIAARTSLYIQLMAKKINESNANISSIAWISRYQVQILQENKLIVSSSNSSNRYTYSDVHHILRKHFQDEIQFLGLQVQCIVCTWYKVEIHNYTNLKYFVQTQEVLSLIELGVGKYCRISPGN